MTYGLSAQADVSAHGIRYDSNFGSTFHVWRGSDVVGELSLRVPGMHNVYNALAAIAVGFELEVSVRKDCGGTKQLHRRRAEDFRLRAKSMASW
jgi:UDP-N-acetylmuramate--alanine ligase